jgi:hypothetical protein
MAHKSAALLIPPPDLIFYPYRLYSHIHTMCDSKSTTLFPAIKPILASSVRLLDFYRFLESKHSSQQSEVYIDI